MSLRKTTEQFIKEAKQIHGDKYTYEKVNYINSITAVKIYCKKCEEYFEKKPMNFINSKQGCPRCGIKERNKKNTYTTEQFIEKAKQIHGDKYDYSLVDYKYNDIEVKIKCIKHNYWFEQTPFSHLQGYGCSICGNEIRKQKCSDNNPNKKSQEQFIKEAKQIHGDKYDYSLVEYVNDKTKVKITCKKCGNIFEQKPNNHIGSKQGCPVCKKGIKKTQEQFLKEIKEIHCDRYDCSLVKYTNDKTNVELICNKCGEHFFSKPSYLLRGSGCPYCHKKSLGEEKIENFLKKENIKFEMYKKFKDLKDIKNLSYDFYLPDYNLLIEYNGIQHYKWHKGFQPTLHDFHRQLHHDWLKRKYARKNNIELMVIKYTELRKINEILKLYFQSNNLLVA